MKFLLIFILFVTYVHAKTVLVMNSNSGINKYQQTQEAFEKDFEGDFTSIDISQMTQKEIEKYLYDEYPDIVYTIGSRAYQYAYKYIPEKKIFFSSIINWNRLPKKKHFSGVLTELHSEMQLTMIRSIFTNTKIFSIVHSKYTKDIISAFINGAKHVGFEIIAQEVESSADVDINKLLNQSDALIVIPDPVVLKNKDMVENIFKIASLQKKPVIAYDKLFFEHGAVLSISVDTPTIGRQVAIMIQNYINKKSTTNIQYPSGTNIVLNKKIVKELDIKFNSASSI